MAEKKKMSIEEILAAARKADGKDGAGSTPTKAPKQENLPVEDSPKKQDSPEKATPKPTTGKPAAATTGSKPAAGGKPGQMSVAEILAAARAEKGEGTAKSAGQASPKAASMTGGDIEKPAAQTAAKKDIPKKEVADKKEVSTKEVSGKADSAKSAAGSSASSSVPRDTASILAAARTSHKPGPMSKAEAEAKGKPVEVKGKPKLEAPPMPAKPDYAKSKAPAQATRRGFVSSVMAAIIGSPMAIGMSSLAVTHLLWGLGLARFMFPNVLTEPPTRFKVGFPDDYGPGQVENKFKAQFGVWVVRHEYEGQNQIFALQTVCTHLGCTPNWLEGEQKFKCPCHGSGFYKDGVNFEGPAPRPLERFAIRISDDGQLEVDKSRKFQEEIGQWKDPASFVPV